MSKSLVSSAILVVEFQKTWTERGLFHRLIRQQLASRGVVENSRALLRDAREHGLTIIHAPLVLDPTRKAEYRRMPRVPKLARQFTAGTWKAEYTDGVFAPSDLEATGRTAFDACEGSNLLELLEREGVRTVFAMGFTTDHCVAYTLDTLAQEGLECVLITDCTATKTARLQRRTEARFQTTSSSELRRALHAGAAQA